MSDRPDELSPESAGGRTGTQTGLVGGVLTLLRVFDVVDLTVEQTTAILVVVPAVLAYCMRIVENRLGWGLLRKVPEPVTPKPRRRRPRAKRSRVRPAEPSDET